MIYMYLIRSCRKYQVLWLDPDGYITSTILSYISDAVTGSYWEVSILQGPAIYIRHYD